MIEAHHDLEAQIAQRLEESAEGAGSSEAAADADIDSGGHEGSSGAPVTSPPAAQAQEVATTAAPAPRPARQRRPRRNMEPVPIQPAPRAAMPVSQPLSPRARTPTPPPTPVDDSVDVMSLPQPHDAHVDASPFELQMLRHHLDAVLRHVLGMDGAGAEAGAAEQAPDLSLVSFKVLRRSVGARVGREQEFEEKAWRSWFKAEVNLQLERLL